MATTPKGPRGRRLTPPGNPEIPKRASLEIMKVYLKNEPEIIDFMLHLIETCGYKTGPEAVKHLLYAGIAATPADGEWRAAMNSVKSQMTQFAATLIWRKLHEAFDEYMKIWLQMSPKDVVEAEIARLRFERGEISEEEFKAAADKVNKEPKS